MSMQDFPTPEFPIITILKRQSLGVSQTYISALCVLLDIALLVLLC